MSVTNCPSCNTPVPPGSIFCDNCGYDLRGAVPTPAAPAPPQDAPSVSGGEITCPTCGHKNIPGSAFCENCGSQLSGVQAPAPPYQPPAEPAPAPPEPEYQPPAPAAPSPPPSPVAPAAVVAGRLVIQAANASLPIPEGKQVIVLGREDPVSGIFPDIDLDPYGAQEEGVGRKHAQLVIKSGQVCIEDLDSVNGTVVNKQRIPPNEPHPINDGDELRLGKMVLIYHAG